MRRVRIHNPTIDNTYETYLAADYVPATHTTTLTAYNNSSFAANDIALVGNPSEERAEIKKLTGISSTDALLLASQLRFPHQKGTPVRRVIWSYVEIERLVLGVWTQITQSAIQWDNKNNETVYFDEDGTQASEYRFRFYNDVTSQYSEYSPTLTGAGFARNQVGAMIKNVRLLTNDLDRKYIEEDAEIVGFFNGAQDIVYSRNPRYWFLLVDAYKRGVSIAALADTSVYSLDSLDNFGHLESVRYEYNSGGSHTLDPLIYKPSGQFDRDHINLNRPTGDRPQHYKIIPGDSDSANGYIQVAPTIKTSGVGTFYPNYYEKMEDLNSVDDATQVPLPRLLENFAISEVERIKGNETKADTYEKLFFGPADMQKKNARLTGLALLDSLDNASKRASGSPMSIRLNRRGRHNSGSYRDEHDRDYERENYM